MINNIGLPGLIAIGAFLSVPVVVTTPIIAIVYFAETVGA